MRLIIKLFCGLLFAVPTFANTEGGGSVDNGGQYLALKFTRMGFEALSAMKKLNPSDAILGLQDLERFELALIKTRVDAVKGPIRDNQNREVDARFLEVNGKPVIEIDDNRWPRFLEDLENVHRLVFHEYLRAMRVDDDNYKVSARLEQGLAREILRGRVVVNPGGVGRQSKFEQLGDYFKMASLPVERDFGLKDKWRGICFDKNDNLSNRELSIKEMNGGPLFPSPIYEVIFGLWGAGALFRTPDMKQIDGSLYVRHPSFSDYENARSWFFRRKDGMLFMELFSSTDDGDDESPASGAPKARCYFW